MHKQALVSAVARKVTVPRVAVEAVINEAVASITAALCEGEQVRIAGFGTFTVANKPERVRRNPATGEPVTVPAHRAVKFKAGTAVRDAMRGGE